MISGQTQGFSKTLELSGTGYRVSLDGLNLKIIVGFSHPVIVKPKTGIQFQVEGNNVIKILGFDKQLVGQTAAEIRKIRKPEPYKGKGIHYQGEKIKRKAGKVAKAGTTAAPGA
jgi:large subunit ribosomal protein L6